MIAYVVTEGTYSDYHITGVFSTQEKANKYVEALQHKCIRRYLTLNDEIRIEEYDVDSQKPDPIEEINAWICSYWPSEDRWEAELFADAWELLEKAKQIGIKDNDNRYVQKIENDDGSFYVTIVDNPTKEAALKIANERIMQQIANEKREIKHRWALEMRFKEEQRKDFR